MEATREQPEISAQMIREELKRILASKVFARSERMKRFLAYAVEQSLIKRGPSLKEYAIALAVYDKPDSFDPRIDPIVRVEASRLRAKLREYYDDEGRNSPIAISIRKRGYAAVIRKRKRPEVLRNRWNEASIENSTGTDNPDAHHLYLKGRYCWNKRTSTAILESIDCFREAIALDPHFALAYAGLAECYASQAWLEETAPAKAWCQVEESANKALELDEATTQSITALACKKAIYDWDWNGAEVSFRRVITSNPDYATARHWYAIFCLAPQRRLTAALAEITRACEMDPLSPAINTHVGWVLYFRRQYQEAIDQYRRTIELDPGFSLVYWYMAYAHVQLSQFDDAVHVVNEARSLQQNTPMTVATLGYVYASMGNRKDAVKMLDELKRMSSNAYVSPVRFTLLHAALGDRDAAFQFLSKAQNERSSWLIHLRIEPALDKLKTDARFRSILSSMGLL